MSKLTTTKVRAHSRFFQNLWADLQLLPSRMLVRHARAIEMIILILGFAIGFYAVVTLLFVQPYVDTTVQRDTTPKLDTEALDTLELWLEERQTATENPLQLNQPDAFVTTQPSNVH